MFVTALKSFDHNGRIKRGDKFECSDLVAQALKRAKLVSFEETVNPTMADCTQPSALPPAPPLQQTIVKQSESGEGKVAPKPKKKPGRKKKSSSV